MWDGGIGENFWNQNELFKLLVVVAFNITLA